MNSKIASLMVVCSILVFNASSLFAAFYTGNDLIPLMRENDKSIAGIAKVDYVKVREYGAYISGVYDVTSMHYNMPFEIERVQVIAVVSNYLKKNPDKLSYSASSLIRQAFKEAFGEKQ